MPHGRFKLEGILLNYITGQQQIGSTKIMESLLVPLKW